MTRNTYILCECCALMLANNDESGCRDYHRHAPASLDVPSGTAISQGPHTWDGTLDLACHGHEDGLVQPGGTFWVAESEEPPATESAVETPIPARSSSRTESRGDPDV